MIGPHDDLTAAEKPRRVVGGDLVSPSCQFLGEMAQAAFQREGKVFVHMPAGGVQGLLG